MNSLEPRPASIAHQNGQTPAPPAHSGAGSIGGSQTIFPPDDAQITWRSFFYVCQHTTIAGARLARAFWVVGAAVVLLWLPGWLPGGQWVSAAAAALLLLCTIVALWLRRGDYVAFQPDAPPQPPLAPITPEDKVGVHVTGCLSVEGRTRRYTWLPGFYRTFATREHALLCHCHPNHARRIGRWPTEEIGLWYAFFRPDEIVQVSWGTLRFAGPPRRAIAVDCEQIISNPRNTRKHISRERLYITFENEEYAQLVWADLLWDRQRASSEGRTTVRPSPQTDEH